jgi:hypothetical protein
MSTDGGPDIPTPDPDPPPSVAEHPAHVRPGPHYQPPVAINPQDPFLPTNIDHSAAWELIYAVKNLQRTARYWRSDALWPHYRDRLMVLYSQVRHQPDPLSREIAKAILEFFPHTKESH